jgi:hypothetical protein
MKRYHAAMAIAAQTAAETKKSFGRGKKDENTAVCLLG